MAPDEVAAELRQVIQEEQAKILRLQEEKEALTQEFSSANTPDEVKEIVLQKIREAGVIAISKLTYLIEFAESESVQASVSRYVTDLILADKLSPADDSLGQLLKQLAETSG